jgi:hypothetical protein
LERTAFNSGQEQQILINALLAQPDAPAIAALVSVLRDEIAARNRVVVVGYSEGSLIANAAYQLILQENAADADEIGILFIGPIASRIGVGGSVFGNPTIGYHTSDFLDLAIGTIREGCENLANDCDVPLFANVSSLGADFIQHGLKSHYLFRLLGDNKSASAEQIIDQIRLLGQ